MAGGGGGQSPRIGKLPGPSSLTDRPTAGGWKAGCGARPSRARARRSASCCSCCRPCRRPCSSTWWCSRRCTAWPSCCREGGAGGDPAPSRVWSPRQPNASHVRAHRLRVGVSSRARAPAPLPFSSTSHASRRISNRVRAVRSAEREQADCEQAESEVPSSASRARRAPRADRGVCGTHTSCCSAGPGCAGGPAPRRESSHALSSERTCRLRRAAPSRSPAGLRCSCEAEAASMASRWIIAATHWPRPSVSDANSPGMSPGRLVSKAASSAGRPAARCASGLRINWLEPAKPASRGALVGQNRSAGSTMPPVHRGCGANQRTGSRRLSGRSALRARDAPK
eukprot:scaffold33362_cov101-Isochrysis_galbana.AAC.2